MLVLANMTRTSGFGDSSQQRHDRKWGGLQTVCILGPVARKPPQACAFELNASQRQEPIRAHGDFLNTIA